MEKTYIIEYTWGLDNPIREEMEVTTPDIDYTLEQIGRNRGGIRFTSVKEKILLYIQSMRKNLKNKEIFIDEFRKKVGNDHFLYKNGEWVKVNLNRNTSPR